MKRRAEWNAGTVVLKGRWEMRDPSVWLWCDFKRLCLKQQALMLACSRTVMSVWPPTAGQPVTQASCRACVCVFAAFLMSAHELVCLFECLCAGTHVALAVLMWLSVCPLMFVFWCQCVCVCPSCAFLHVCVCEHRGWRSKPGSALSLYAQGVFFIFSLLVKIQTLIGFELQLWTLQSFHHFSSNS